MSSSGNIAPTTSAAEKATSSAAPNFQFGRQYTNKSVSQQVGGRTDRWYVDKETGFVNFYNSHQHRSEGLSKFNEAQQSLSSSASILQSAAEIRSQQTPFIPTYKAGQNFDQIGSVNLDNAIYNDKITGQEFTELLEILFNSKTLLSQSNLSVEQIRHKHVLLGILVSLNWGVIEPVKISRLEKAIEDRIKSTNIIQR